VLDVLVQTRRNKKAALKLMRRVGNTPAEAQDGQAIGNIFNGILGAAIIEQNRAECRP
jgi:hypothetical protein